MFINSTTRFVVVYKGCILQQSSQIQSRAASWDLYSFSLFWFFFSTSLCLRAVTLLQHPFLERGFVLSPKTSSATFSDIAVIRCGKMDIVEVDYTNLIALLTSSLDWLELVWVSDRSIILTILSVILVINATYIDLMVNNFSVMMPLLYHVLV